MTAIVLPMWIRLGSCEPGLCGSACCRFIVLEVNPIYLADADTAAWVRLHGIELTERNGRTLARLPLPCTALDSDGRCTLYGSPERPDICVTFPVTPAALLGVDNVCTFAFTPTAPT
jgi:Fe-S-cluster containining protein